MKNLGVLLFFVGVANCLMAFESDLISERPGQALSPNCLKRGDVQIQSGINFSRLYYSGPTLLPVGVKTTPDYESVKNTVIRFGLGKKFEINTVFDYSMFDGVFYAPIVGFKASLFKNEKNDFALQYNTIIHQFNDENYSSTLKFISSHQLNSSFGFTFNGGAQYKPSQDAFNTDYVFSLSYNPTSRIGMILENYGTYDGDFKTYFDIGIGFLVTPQLQLDTYFGGSKNNYDEEVFINAGLTYRFKV